MSRWSRWFCFWSVAVVGIPLLSGCPDGGHHGGGRRSRNELSGTAVDGRVRNGAGKVFALATDGSREDVGDIATDAAGEYAVTLRRNLRGPVLVELTSGEYTDAATGQTRDLSPAEPLAAVAVADGGPLTVHLSALTTLAALLLDPGAFADEDALAAGIVALNEAVGEAFGLIDQNGNPVDVTTLRPLDLTDGADAQAYDQDPGSLEAEAGRLAGGLAELAEAAGLSVPELIQALAVDGADGAFDGLDAAGNPVPGLDLDTLTSDLADGIAEFLGESHVVQTFQGAGLPPPDPDATEVEEQQVELATSGGGIALPEVPGAPTPESVAVLGLAPPGFINAATDEDALDVDVELGPDALAGDEIELRVTDTGGATSVDTQVLASGGAQTVSFTVDTSTMDEGDIRFVARLLRGNATSNGVSTNIVKDETLPTGTITSPGNGVVLGGAPAVVTAVAQDDLFVAEVEFTATVALQSVSETDGTEPFSVALDLTPLADGPGIIRIAVTDLAGNVTADADSTNFIHNFAGPPLPTGVWDASSWDQAVFGP